MIGCWTPYWTYQTLDPFAFLKTDPHDLGWSFRPPLIYKQDLCKDWFIFLQTNSWTCRRSSYTRSPRWSKWRRKTRRRFWKAGSLKSKCEVSWSGRRHSPALLKNIQKIVNTTTYIYIYTCMFNRMHMQTSTWWSRRWRLISAMNNVHFAMKLNGIFLTRFLLSLNSCLARHGISSTNIVSWLNELDVQKCFFFSRVSVLEGLPSLAQLNAMRRL